MPTMSVSNEEDCVHVELEIDPDELGPVDEIVEEFESLNRDLMEAVIETVLGVRLKQDLGPKWGSDNAFEARGCPRCGSRQATRKEYRSRTVTPRSGEELEIARPVVTCEGCGSEYRPYDEELGLSDTGHQYTVQALVSVMKEAIKTTYKKASGLLEEGPSPRTIWRYVTGLVPETEEDSGEDDPGDQPVVVDGTQVPRWRESGQHVVSVAHGLTSLEDGWGHTVLGTSFGDEADIKPVLSEVDPSDLIHDGRLELESVVEAPRRCRWHVTHSVRQLLYHDEITGETNRFLTNQLKQLVWDEESDESNYRVQLIQWARRYEAYAPQTAAHVRYAVEGLVKTRRRKLQTTSLVEREMREINKRFENGGGWTQYGGKAMIKHHQMLRHNPKKWRTQMAELVGNAVTSSSQNSVI